MTKYWTGTPPSNCDLCHQSLVNASGQGEFYDARVPSAGWGCICRQCFVDHGCRLGTGSGQHYRKPVGSYQWEKIDG